MVAISALAVVPAGQVNAASTAVALNKAIRALINVSFTAGPSEALWAGTHIGSNAGSSVPAPVFAKCFADGAISREPWLADAVVPAHGVEAERILIAVVLVGYTFVMLCA